MDLNEKQLEAVAAPSLKSLLVSAGAGTGKTKVLVQRYMKFVFDDGIDPDRILALTFTVKAASEMRRRIFEQAAAKGDKDVYRKLHRAPIMNFHSYCRRLMRENPMEFPLSPDAEVASGIDILRIESRIKRNFAYGAVKRMPADLSTAVLTPTNSASFVDECLAVAARAKAMMLTPGDLLRYVREEDDRDYKIHVEAIAAVWDAYEEELTGRNLIDFPAMISLAVKTLKNNTGSGSGLAGSYDAILIDEFQDTSFAQNELIRIISGGSFSKVTVVGDIRQSIYRWRDATLKNITGFPGEALDLNINYRSAQEILDLAHAFITREGSGLERVPGLYSERGAGKGAVSVFHPQQESGSSQKDEARALSTWILGLAGRLNDKKAGEFPRASIPLSFGDFAVLLRTLLPSGGLPDYEAELRRQGIPYAVVGASASLESAGLSAFCDYLSLLIYPGNVRSLLRLLEAPPLSLDDMDLQDLFAAARRLARKECNNDEQKEIDVDLLLSPGAIEALTTAESRARCKALARSLQSLRSRRGSTGPVSFVWEAFEQSSVMLGIFNEAGSSEEAVNMTRHLQRIAAELENRNELNLSAFIEHLRALTRRKSRADIEAPLPEGKVKIMTIHQAKGLEFKAVAVPGMKSRKRGTPGFFLNRSGGLYIGSYQGRDPAKIDEARQFLMDMKHEERCVYYVAFTRPRDHLLVSSPFPEGTKKEDEENFFTDVLTGLKEQGIPFCELRNVPDLDRAVSHDGDKVAVPPHEKAAESIDKWLSFRTGLKEKATDPFPPGGALRFCTWTGLKTFDECPRMYKLLYADRLAVSGGEDDELHAETGGFSGKTAGYKSEESREQNCPIPGLDALQFGRLMHKLLEELASFESFRRSDAAPRALVLAQGLGAGKEAKSAIETVIPSLMEPFFEEAEKGGTRIITSEEPFYLRGYHAVFTGIIDRLDETGSGLRVVDYKTGSAGGKREKDYNFQVRFYAWAVKEMHHKPVEGVLWYLGGNQRKVRVDTGAASLQDIGRTAGSFDEALSSGIFEPRETAPCEWCAFKNLCVI